MIRSLCCPLALASAAALAVLGAAGPLPAQEQGISGDFRVAAIRRASDVVGGPEDPSLGEVGIGTKVSFGEALTWLWGEDCADWSTAVAPAPILMRDDPLLSDT